jgi:uncharacterized protein (TIGR00299 family) protein
LKIAYFDCFSGISGDMCLGALINAGAPLKSIKQGLKKIPLKGYELTVKEVRRSGIKATKLETNVTTPLKGPLKGRTRGYREIKALIGKSTLSPRIKSRGIEIFRGLFEAEAAVHGVPYDRAHLHELGAVDCVVDVMGALIGLESLGIEKVFSSPVNLGSGETGTAHGTYPVPAPATVQLLRDVPVYSSGTPYELTTPTGAAILKGVCSGFCGIPVMTLDAVGTGAGQRDIRGRPNVLRVLVGRQGAAPEEVVLIEANIDDMNPQVYEYAMERLFRAGALDVYLTQIIMKKGRPAVKMTVLCAEHDREALVGTMLTETTTLGVRVSRAERVVLERTVRKVDTGYGTIRVKEARTGDGALRKAPEYDDCRRAAKRHGVPLLEVFRECARRLDDGSASS